METVGRTELGSFLKILPPVEFCCVYGSRLHPNNHDKILINGILRCIVLNTKPHLVSLVLIPCPIVLMGPILSLFSSTTKNLEMNRDHYASWIVHGAKLITKVADGIGVGVHFNPFVSWNEKMYKYGVVRMDDLHQDMLNWESFYFCGRLQKPVRIIVDKSGIGSINSLNLRAASSAALLLLPSKFTERDLYTKICSLSYMGDLRMFFTEDKNKVKKIVDGQFDFFKTMYNPLLEDYATKDLLRFSSSSDPQVNISQDCSSSSVSLFVSFLPATIRNQIGMRLKEKRITNQTGWVTSEAVKEEVADCMQKVLRRKVMISSARQAVAGLLTVGGIHGLRYLSSKMEKAWKSRN